MVENIEKIADTVSAFLRNNDNALSSRGSVVLENVSVIGAGRGVQAASNVLTTIKSWLNPIAYIRRHEPSRTLLHNFSGTISKGEMVLVIGKPGSGCTTFLKTLAGMRGEYKDTTGIITYGGRPSSHQDRDPVQLTFCAEEDEHLPKLTVYETLRFAVRLTWDRRTTEETIDSSVRTLAKLVGLSHVLNTKVGSSSVRGVSGGERRRVTLAEAMATCPDVLCFDNPTHGLDSSTAMEFVEMIRDYTCQRACTTIMSIYQGSNLMVPLFDKAVVIKGGRNIFYGKMSEAKEYFEGLGFVCPERTTTMDFLNSMTAEAAVRHVREGHELKVPTTSEEFEQVFHQSKHSRIVTESIANEKRQPSTLGSKQSVYSLPLYRQVYECAFRQYRVLITSSDALAVEALTIIIQSLVLGTLFRDQARATKSFFILASSLFYSTLVPALQSMSEFGNTFAQRSLVIRQKRYRLYRPMAYALGLVATDAIWKVVAIAYNIPLYFLTGFQYNAANFFTWFVTVYVEHLALSMIFRAIAILSPSIGTAILPVGIMFNMFVLYTGLYVPGPQMQAWLFWLKYLNPLYYAFESVMVNEFADLTYQCSSSDLAPSGLEYGSFTNQVCAVAGSVPGQGTVSGISFLEAQYGFEASHLWRNFGINCGIFIFMAGVTGIGMELHREPAGRLATVFYKAEPKDIVTERSSTTSDPEKGDVRDTPPETMVVATTRRKNQDSQHIGQTLAWQEICWDLKLDGKNRRFLDHINGFVDVGQLTALMGVSGAGKTTLLNALAGRLNEGTFSGELFLGGKPLPKSFSRYMGYVQQADIHLPTQTVREALQMTARLRRSHDVPSEEKYAYVEDVIEMLEMEDIAEALIGVPGAGLNLQQRKRVSLGAELAAKPDIIFLDEPSSGLDGQSAITIIQLLRKLADSGQTIICTIHQPAADLIEIFDHLILLVNGGKVAYDGPLGLNCATALDYFTTSGGRPVEPYENPADYFLETVGAGSRSKATEDWSHTWQSSEAWSKRSSQINKLIKASNESALAPVDSASTYAAPYWLQLKTVLQRTWLYYWREPDYFVSKLLMNIGNSLLNSLTYLQSGHDQKGAYNRVFSSFMSLIVGPPLGLQVAPRFTSLREIFMQREKDSLTYHWSVFVISAIIIELPYTVVTSAVYWLLWYFPVGLFSESSRSGYNFFMYELFAIFATSLAQFTSSLMPSLEATFAANGFFFMFCNTFAGTLSPKPVTPRGWRWFYNISPLYYLGGGLTTDVLEGLEIKCDLSEVSIFHPPNGTNCVTYASDFLQTATGYIMNANSTTDCQYCRYKNGQSYYTQYGYDFTDRYKNLGIFIGFIAFNYTMVIFLTWLTKIHKWKKRT